MKNSLWANYVKEKREASHMKKIELAEKVKLDPTYVAFIEKDGIVPHREKVIQLAKALDCDIDECLLVAGYAPENVDIVEFLEILKKYKDESDVDGELRKPLQEAQNLQDNKKWSVDSENNIAHIHVEKLSAILEEISAKFNENEIRIKSFQLSEINNLIKKFESQNIPIPENIREHKIKLKLDISSMQETINLAERILVSIKDLYDKYSRLILNIKHKDSKKSGSNHYRYTGKKPLSFTFLGKKEEVKSWLDLYRKFLSMITQENPNFKDVLEGMHGAKLKYFSDDPSQLKYPAKIPEVEYYYCEGSTTTSGAVVRNMMNIIEKFGYSEDDIEIEAR